MSALFAFVKHRLPFVRASQLHGVKPQHPMVALWTRLVYGCSLLLDVVVVPFVPYFRPVWVARFDVKFVQKAGGVRGRRLSTTGAEHSLGRVRQRATRARNRRRRRAQVHRASTPRARRRHQHFLLLLSFSSSLLKSSLPLFLKAANNNVVLKRQSSSFRLFFFVSPNKFFFTSSSSSSSHRKNERKNNRQQRVESGG